MKICSILLFTALATISAFGQDLKSVIPQHKPGDTLSYRVEFDGDPAFDHLALAFYHIGEVPKDQPGFTNWFGNISHFTKIKPGVYDVDGAIPNNNLMEGEYQLQHVNASIGPASKEYDAIKTNISIFIKNDAKYKFPPLKSVTPK